MRDVSAMQILYRDLHKDFTHGADFCEKTFQITSPLSVSLSLYFISPWFTHPLQQFAFHEGFGHIVRGSEVPRLVDHMHSLETCRK